MYIIILYSLPSSQVVVPHRRHVVVTGTGGAENRCDRLSVPHPVHSVTILCDHVVLLHYIKWYD